MREIDVSLISKTVGDLCIRACYDLPRDVTEALESALENEESEVGRETLSLLIENAHTAARERMPICQDTGVTIVFAEVGQDVHITGGTMVDAINEGVRRGYTGGYLRKSVVDDPVFARKNSGDNTPAVIYTDIVPGDRLKITVMPKGAGSENMSQVKMMVPADGPEGIVRFVVEAVDRAGSNPCPPVIVGIGIGGMMDKAAQLSKRALLRKVGMHNPNPEIARLEGEILRRVNDLGIGPEGLGGRITALAVHIETWPTHIGAMPVAVTLQCHAARHVESTL
ncbi:MAG: fumarate hydratase [Ignavibacteriales bacterium]